MEIVWLVSGVVLGAIAAWFAANQKLSGKSKEVETNLKVSEEKNNTLSGQLQETKGELDKERNKILELNNNLSSVEADYRNLQEKLEEEKKEVEKLNEKFAIEFKNLANDIFEEKSKRFTEQNKTNIHDLLKPLGEKIGEFEKKVEQTNKDSIDRNSALREQIKQLRDLNLQITKEAENLTKALKGDNKAQGNWGEFILESILEKSGLQKSREYFVQESYTTEEGKRLQPDVILKLPDNKNIIIDSKVTLTAYERFVSGEDETEKLHHLKSHVQAIRSHVKSLSDKDYQKIHQIQGLDFVLMFIPIEPAFALGVQHDSDLFGDAYEKNIVIVSPSTLIATLRTIANIWKNEYQNRHAMEIARQGGALYDKFKSFSDDLIKVGDNLRMTTNNYQAAMNKLTDGKDNLVRKAERIKELGAKASKSIDQRLIERSGED